MSARFRVLLVSAIAEVVTLALLLVNLATVHDPAVARIAGPVHGAVYLLVALVALLSPDLRWGARLLGLVPVVGGLAAVWRARAAARGSRG